MYLKNTSHVKAFKETLSYAYGKKFDPYIIQVSIPTNQRSKQLLVFG